MTKKGNYFGLIQYDFKELNMSYLCWLVLPFKVEIITTSQYCPPYTADVLLGTVDNKFMEALQSQILLFWD